MDFITDFFQLPLKKKLFVIGAIVAWYLSIKFSKMGFGIEYPDFAWIGWVLAGLVTIAELAFNDKDVKPTLTIVILGLVAYAYGIWTNVTGLWIAQNPGGTFVWNGDGAGMAWVVGGIMEIIPEMLIMLAYGRAREADPLGVIAELFSGKLMAGSNKGHNQNQNQNQNKSNNQRFDTSSQNKPTTYSFGASEPTTQPKIERLFSEKKGSHNPQNPRWSGRKN